MSTISLNTNKVLKSLLIIVVVGCVCVLQYGSLAHKDEGNETIDPVVDSNFTSYLRSIEPASDFEFVDSSDDQRFSITSNSCQVESWNQIHTDNIPNQEKHDKWMKKNVYRKNYLYHLTPSPFAAFVHDSHVTVTLSAENKYGKTVYCRYFDCNRKEIPQPFQSAVFPESTVQCGRRIGAKYISITENLEDTPEPPVPIQNRVSVVPQHYFTVCMAALYGSEPKFLQIVDFIEYHKLQGATFFHIYLRNASAYDRMLLDDYVKTGEIELIVLNDNYWRADFMWHNMQINDCHRRSINFSKWTAFIDIDERVEMKGGRVVNFLKSIQDPNINSLQFPIQWVLKYEDTPEKYINDQKLIDEMIFRKYHNTSRVGYSFQQPKCIIRPERVGAMLIHGPIAVYKGYRTTLVNPVVGVIRHYRNVRGGALYKNNELAFKMGPFTNTSIDVEIETQLTENILKRVKSVYDIVTNTCAEKMRIYRMHGGMKADCHIE